MKCRGLLRRTQLGWNNGLFINIYWVSQLIGLEYPAINFKTLLPWPGRRFNLICDSANAFEDKLMFWNPSHASEVTIPSDNVLVMHESVFGCVLDGVLIHACLRRLPSLRSHFTSALFAIDINLDLMKIALMIFYDEIVLSFSRIWRFIVFSFSLFMASLDKSWKETFAAKVRVDDFITGIWDFFECLANRNILLRLWWTNNLPKRSATHLYNGYLGRKKFINQWHDTRFSGSLLKSLSLFTKLSCLFVEISSTFRTQRQLELSSCGNYDGFAQL